MFHTRSRTGLLPTEPGKEQWWKEPTGHSSSAIQSRKDGSQGQVENSNPQSSSLTQQEKLLQWCLYGSEQAPELGQN